MKEESEERHVRNAETKALGSRSGANVENNVSLEDLHPDGATVKRFSWPQLCFLVT